MTGLFRAQWSPKVHEEWISNLLNNRPNLTREKLNRTRHLMDNAAPDALVTDDEHLIKTIDLPDQDNRHELEAAIQSYASVIVTHYLADFPKDVLM